MAVTWKFVWTSWTLQSFHKLGLGWSAIKAESVKCFRVIPFLANIDTQLLVVPPMGIPLSSVILVLELASFPPQNGRPPDLQMPVLSRGWVPRLAMSRSREQFPRLNTPKVLWVPIYRVNIGDRTDTTDPNWLHHAEFATFDNPGATWTWRIRRTAYFWTLVSSMEQAGDCETIGS